MRTALQTAPCLARPPRHLFPLRSIRQDLNRLIHRLSVAIGGRDRRGKRIPGQKEERARTVATAAGGRASWAPGLARAREKRTQRWPFAGRHWPLAGKK